MLVPVNPTMAAFVKTAAPATSSRTVYQVPNNNINNINNNINININNNIDIARSTRTIVNEAVGLSVYSHI